MRRGGWRKRASSAQVGLSMAVVGLLAGLGLRDAPPEVDPEPVAAGDGLRRSSVGSKQVKDGSLRLRDFRPGEVFAFKQGRALTTKVDALGTLSLKIRSELDEVGLKMARTAEEASLKAGDLQRRLEAVASSYYDRAAADQRFAARDEVLAGRGSVLTASATPGGTSAPLLEIPGFGRLDIRRDGQGGTTFSLTNTSDAPFSTATPTGSSLVLQPGQSTTWTLSFRAMTLQLLDTATAGARPAAATVTLSDVNVGRQASDALAQVLVGL